MIIWFGGTAGRWFTDAQSSAKSQSAGLNVCEHSFCVRLGNQCLFMALEARSIMSKLFHRSGWNVWNLAIAPRWLIETNGSGILHSCAWSLGSFAKRTILEPVLQNRSMLALEKGRAIPCQCLATFGLGPKFCRRGFVWLIWFWQCIEGHHGCNVELPPIVLYFMPDFLRSRITLVTYELHGASFKYDEVHVVCFLHLLSFVCTHPGYHPDHWAPEFEGGVGKRGERWWIINADPS